MSLLYIRATIKETFDKYETEGMGSEIDPLVSLEAQKGNFWIDSHVYPLIYELYGSDGLKLNRNTEILGLFPARAIYISNINSPGYLLSGTQSDSKQGDFYIKYFVPIYVHNDYYELLNKAANKYLNSTQMPPPQAQRLLGGMLNDLRGRHTLSVYPTGCQVTTLLHLLKILFLYTKVLRVKCKLYRYSLFTFIFVVFAGLLMAQPDNNISCVALIRKDSVVLRWVPTSVPVWQTGVRYGYVVRRYTIAKDGVFIPDGLNKGELLTRTPIRPVSNDTFDSLAVTIHGAAIVQEAIYGKDFQQSSGTEDFKSFLKAYEDIEVRLGFALFMCDLSPVVAKASGLLFVDSNTVQGERYAYSISLSNIPDGLHVEPAVTVVDAGFTTLLPYVSDVQAIFLDRAVKFRWPVMFHKGIYSAYIFEKSIDGNNKFSPVSDLAAC